MREVSDDGLSSETARDQGGQGSVSGGGRESDASEIDMWGLKFPAEFIEEKTTEHICPKCKNNIKFGRFAKPTNNYFDKHSVYYCPECKSVWAAEEMLPPKNKRIKVKM